MQQTKEVNLHKEIKNSKNKSSINIIEYNQLV
jgi:hypothetical protein